jgi:hypothetical protein
VEQLDQAPPDSFTPDLALLDRLMASFDVQPEMPPGQ